MSELWLRKEAALRSLEIWYAQDQRGEMRRDRIKPEGVRRRPVENRYGVPADSAEYMKLYMRDRRAKQGRT